MTATSTPKSVNLKLRFTLYTPAPVKSVNPQYGFAPPRAKNGRLVQLSPTNRPFLQRPLPQFADLFHKTARKPKRATRRTLSRARTGSRFGDTVSNPGSNPGDTQGRYIGGVNRVSAQAIERKIAGDKNARAQAQTRKQSEVV